MNLLVATNNEHKIKEIEKTIHKILGHKSWSLILPKALFINISPLEIYDTLEKNAELKAIDFYNVAHIPTIADDSGLEIDALDGLPGVHSARFTDEHNDKKNRLKVLNLLEGEINRNARFRTVIAYFNGVTLECFEGICNGKIIQQERGENGFGYDSIFVPDGYSKTFAEMSDEEKNSISHRYKAIAEFVNAVEAKI